MKTFVQSIGTALVLAFVWSSAHAQNLGSAPSIADVWVRATVPGSTVSAAYMSIKSAKPLRLVKAQTPVADIAELHDMKLKEGVMEMNAKDAIEVPAGKAIDLRPGGMHIMLMKVKQPIRAGDKVPLTLTFEDDDRKPLVINLDAVAQEKNPYRRNH